LANDSGFEPSAGTKDRVRPTESTTIEGLVVEIERDKMDLQFRMNKMNEVGP
jgi:hypothetical protein